MPPHLSLKQSKRTLDPEEAADHRARLLGIAWSLCGSRHLAEDLTQETYARVFAKPRRVHSDFPYLVRTLHNVLKDHWRTEARRPRVVGEVDEMHPCRRDLDEKVLAGEVCSAVADLPGDFRAVVGAVDLLGLSYNQAAYTLRLPLGTVMSRLSRGRSRVAIALA